MMNGKNIMSNDLELIKRETDKFPSESLIITNTKNYSVGYAYCYSRGWGENPPYYAIIKADGGIFTKKGSVTVVDCSNKNIINNSYTSSSEIFSFISNTACTSGGNKFLTSDGHPIKNGYGYCNSISKNHIHNSSYDSISDTDRIKHLMESIRYTHKRKNEDEGGLLPTISKFFQGKPTLKEKCREAIIKVDFNEKNIEVYDILSDEQRREKVHKLIDDNMISGLDRHIIKRLPLNCADMEHLSKLKDQRKKLSSLFFTDRELKDIKNYYDEIFIRANMWQKRNREFLSSQNENYPFDKLYPPVGGGDDYTKRLDTCLRALYYTFKNPCISITERPDQKGHDMTAFGRQIEEKKRVELDYRDNEKNYPEFTVQGNTYSADGVKVRCHFLIIIQRDNKGFIIGYWAASVEIEIGDFVGGKDSKNCARTVCKITPEMITRPSFQLISGNIKENKKESKNGESWFENLFLEPSYEISSGNLNKIN